MTIVAIAKLQGLGADESAPIECLWSRLPLRISLASLPWLALFGLCVLKSNRRIQAWLVWPPILVIWALVLGIQNWSGITQEPFSPLIQLLPTALAFGWAAVLLLAPEAGSQRLLTRLGVPLVGFGVLSLLTLAVSNKWQQEFLLDITCAILLQFVLAGITLAMGLTRFIVSRRRFSVPSVLGWFVLWLLLVWIAFLVPASTLSLLGNQNSLGPLVAVGGTCYVTSLFVTLPFIGLAAISPLYHRRLQQFVGVSQPVPASAAPPHFNPVA